MESLGNRLLGGDAGGVRWLWLLSLSASSMMRLLHHHWSARWLFCCCGLLAPNGWTPGYQCWRDDWWYNAEIWWYITYIAMDGQLLCRHEVRRFARSFTYFHFCFVVGRLLNLVCRLRHVPFCEYIAMIKIWLWNSFFSPCHWRYQNQISVWYHDEIGAIVRRIFLVWRANHLRLPWTNNWNLATIFLDQDQTDLTSTSNAWCEWAAFGRFQVEDDEAFRLCFWRFSTGEVHVFHAGYPGRSPSWLHPWALLWPCGWVPCASTEEAPQTFRLSPTFFSLSHLTLWPVYSHQQVIRTFWRVVIA